MHVSRHDRTLYDAARYLEHVSGRRFAQSALVGRVVSAMKRRAEAGALATLRMKGSGRLIPITEARDCPASAVHEGYVRRAVPIVLRGLAADWPCLSRWTVEAIRERYGEVPVFLIEDDIATDHSVGRKVPLREVIDSMGANQPLYARFVPIIHRDPGILDDLDMDYCGHVIHPDGDVHIWGMEGEGVPLRSHFFVGDKGRETHLHCELTNNLFINVYGVKRWILYPPTYNICFRSPVNRNPGVFGSSFDPTRPDFERYPLARFADYYDITLEPGDVLYVPPFYWHYVQTRSNNISLGLRWYSFAAANRSSVSQNMMTFIATNPTMFKALKAPIEYGETHGGKKSERLQRGPEAAE